MVIHEAGCRGEVSTGLKPRVRQTNETVLASPNGHEMAPPVKPQEKTNAMPVRKYRQIQTNERTSRARETSVRLDWVTEMAV